MDYQTVRGNDFFHKKRSKTEKLLCSFLVLVIILTVILGIFLLFMLLKDKKIDDLQTISNEISKKMNKNVNPCDDFYEFVCGNYIKNTVIPPSKTTVDSFLEQSEAIDKQMYQSFNEANNEKDTKPIKILKKIYRSCMNQTDIELNSMKTLKEIIKNLGGWPVIEGEKWQEKKFNWTDLTINIRNIGMSYKILFEFTVDLDNKNSSRRVLTIDQPFLPFQSAKKGPRNSKTLNAIHELMVDIVVEFGGNKKDAINDMNDVLDLEIELVKIFTPIEERREMEEEYNPMTIKELQKNYPVIPNWHNFINEIIKPSKLNLNDTVIVPLPDYLIKLQELLKRTNKKTLANLMIYKAIGALSSYSTNNIKEILLNFSNKTIGVTSSKPMHEECILVVSRLDVAAGALYVRNYFNKESKIKTEEMVSNIEKEYLKTLENIDWMDVDTKKEALDKLKVMNKYVGYPDELFDDEKLDEYYKDLELNTNNYLEIILKVAKFQINLEMEQLNEPVIKNDWKRRTQVAIVNAFYDLNDNSIQVPAGILQGPFFNSKRPNYLNYGGIGYIIGHEFTHGFDDEGSQLDKNGNLRSWWQNSTKEAFKNKTKCIIDQYSSIVVPEVNLTINGITTQGENIADSGGIKLAYNAYTEWLKINKKEEKLPGFGDYNEKQMFWIGAANVWCSKEKNEQLEQDLLSNMIHSPDKYRINIPFANSHYFAEDFNCPKGSNMNPINTCTVW